jgi:hypothetical protein
MVSQERQRKDYAREKRNASGEAFLKMGSIVCAKFISTRTNAHSLRAHSAHIDLSDHDSPSPIVSRSKACARRL